MFSHALLKNTLYVLTSDTLGCLPFLAQKYFVLHTHICLPSTCKCLLCLPSTWLLLKKNNFVYNDQIHNSPKSDCSEAAVFVWEIEAKKGWPSADRNNKATLLLTGPFHTTKSSAKDLIPRVMKLQYTEDRRTLRAHRKNRLLGYEAKAYSYTSITCGKCRRVLAWILT